MRFLVVLSAAAFLVGCSDSRCSAENCKTMREPCRVEFGASPSYNNCARANLIQRDSKEFKDHESESCSNACNATEAGDLLDCIAELAPQCEQTPVMERGALVQSSCVTPGGPARDPSCVRACHQTRRACDDGCPVTTFKACGDCSARCGLDWVTCVDGCIVD